MEQLINEVINNSKEDTNISQYKELFKESITKYLMLHSEEYKWLCKQVNVTLFGQEIVEIVEETIKEEPKSGLMQKFIRATVKLHIYRECKIIYQILKVIGKSLKDIIKLIWRLFKQISKRFLNLLKIGRKK